MSTILTLALSLHFLASDADARPGTAASRTADHVQAHDRQTDPLLASADERRTTNFTLELDAKTDYRLVACGDDSVRGMALMLYDERGEQLASGSANGGGCVVLGFTPSQTGSYQAVLLPQKVVRFGDGGMALTVVSAMESDDLAILDF